MLVGKSRPPIFLSDLEDFFPLLGGDRDFDLTRLFFLLGVGEDTSEAEPEDDILLERDLLFSASFPPEAELRSLRPNAVLTVPASPATTFFRRAEASEITKQVITENNYKEPNACCCFTHVRIMNTPIVY